MWEVSLPHLVLAALCGKFLLEKKKATETERECVSMRERERETLKAKMKKINTPK